MANIEVHFKDGTKLAFRHTGRPGGSYTKRVKYTEGWVIVNDEYDREVAFPSETVARVETEPHYASF